MDFAQKIGLHSPSLRRLFVKLFVSEMKQRKSKALDNLLLFVAGAYPYVCFLVFMLLASGRLSTDGGMLALAYINGFIEG